MSIIKMRSKEEKLLEKLEKLRLKEGKKNGKHRPEVEEVKERKEGAGRKKEKRVGDNQTRSGTRKSNCEESKEVTEKHLDDKQINKLTFARKKQLKKELILAYLEEYKKPIKTSALGVTHEPSQKDIKDYERQLTELSLKDLQELHKFKHYPLKLDLMDRLKSIDKKKFAVVTIFNDNKTTDTGVCQCYSRTFSRRGMTYIVMSERGIYDPEFKMTHFYYYANIPFPILFQKKHDPDAIADAKLLDDTIEMKVIEALANIDMANTLKLVLFFGVITMIISAVTLIINLKSSGVIGG